MFSSEENLVTIRVPHCHSSFPFHHYISQDGWDVENGFKLEFTTFAQGKRHQMRPSFRPGGLCLPICVERA